MELDKDKFKKDSTNYDEHLHIMVSKKDLFRLTEMKSKEEKRLRNAGYLDEDESIAWSEFGRILLKDQINKHWNNEKPIIEL